MYTICFELVVSPILNCVNGHLVCGLCSEKISKCPLCKTVLNVSSFAERLVRKYEFKRECLNRDLGCMEMIVCVNMKNHLETCEFKDVVYKCHLCAPAENDQQLLHTLYVNNNSTYSRKEFIPHLLEEHNLWEKKSGNRWKTPMNESWEHMINRGLTGLMIREDGNEFLLHTEIIFGGTTMNRWITILGNHNEAKNYDYLISVKPQRVNQDQRKIGLVWRSPVSPFTGNSSFQDVSKSGKYCSIDQSAVETLFASQNGSFGESSFPIVCVKIVKWEAEKDDENYLQLYYNNS